MILYRNYRSSKQNGELLLINDAATALIDAYLEADMLVPHAILVDGPWGSGKTYFLEKIYKPTRQDEGRAKRSYRTPLLFVSLFGVKTADDVERRVHRAASPVEFAIGKAIGTIIRGFSEFFQVKDAAQESLGGIGKRAARRHVGYILVFDDLERVEKGALTEIMSYINSLITKDRRVILVADEQKLLEIHVDSNWNEHNEKIVGRRIRIDADVESVVRRSVDGIHDAATKAFITDHIEKLITLTRQSTVQNLRNVAWAIVNGTRFVRSLIADAEIPREHISRTLLIVVATTLWSRSNLISKEALELVPNISTKIAARTIGMRNQGSAVAVLTEEEKAKKDMEEAAGRFSKTFAGLSVESPTLEYGRIAAFEASGILDDAAFIAWTKTQFGFGEGRAEPAWRRLWHSFNRPIDESEKAIQELSSELASFAHTTRATILHSASSAIKFGNVGDTRLTGGKDVVTYFISYIDELVKSGTLKVPLLDHLSLENDTAHGLQFSSNHTSEFKQIHEYLLEKFKEIEPINQSNKADAIVKEAEAGNFEVLHTLNSANNELSRIPVMLQIDAGRMARLMTADMPAVFSGAKFLSNRYSDNGPSDLVMNEIPWARTVYELMNSELQKWPENYRDLAIGTLQSFIRRYEKDRPPEQRILPSEWSA